MTINPRYPLGKIVYLKVGEDAGMVTGFELRPVGANFVINYFVTFGDETGERICYECELTDEKTFTEPHE